MRSLLLQMALAVVIFMPDSVPAQDVLATDKNIQLRLENDRVRVLERTLQPGERESLHSHPSYVVYVVQGGRLRVHRNGGQFTESDFKSGDVLYMNPVTHWAENVGTSSVQVILVELKEQAGPSASGR